MGKSISMYQVVRVSDPKLQNKQSVDRCVQILAFLRLVMQVVLPKEKLCWLIYNGKHKWAVTCDFQQCRPPSGTFKTFRNL